MSVAYSIVPYGASIWWKAIEIKRNADGLRRLQRRMALRISAGYRTTSTDALLVVAGMPPIELTVEERVRRAKKEKRSVEEERHETVKRWQRQFGQISKGKWTRKLKPEATPWYYRDHGEKNHFLTQLPGFQPVSPQNREDSQRNGQCGSQIETAEHLFLECEKWRSERESMRQKISSDINTDEIGGHMIRTGKQWDAVSEFTTRVLKRKMNEAKATNARNMGKMRHGRSTTPSKKCQHNFGGVKQQLVGKGF
ncbi:hypothetical protein Zmor_002939 [Zophobas morio]|uniref:Reverse transcriptase domain-containing protein n=1 Tax=Zophobas morio TaxID=2755281 RepID=A0AA38HKX7_9CUCU|nr:hypothetical protein Zmor_002939 [Zophobas morio]